MKLNDVSKVTTKLDLPCIFNWQEEGNTVIKYCYKTGHGVITEKIGIVVAVICIHALFVGAGMSSLWHPNDIQSRKLS